MCLAQGHNAAAPVRFEPAAPRSRVRHSTTEPLRSLANGLLCSKGKTALYEKLFSCTRPILCDAVPQTVKTNGSRSSFKLSYVTVFNSLVFLMHIQHAFRRALKRVCCLYMLYAAHIC